jgi:hypothetical protein
MRLTAVVLALLLPLAACAGEENIKATDIVTEVPWPEEETATYRILDDDDEEVGTAELSVRPGDDGQVVLRQYYEFPETAFVNQAEVYVDLAELQPLRTSFRIEGPDGTRECTAEYGDGRVDIHTVGEDGEHDDSLDVPIVAYDSWSDLFLWRTIEFSQGYETEYADILSCVLARAQRIGAELRVAGSETIKVPAGTFETWHVEIDAGREQDAWFTTDESHVLVRYDNGEQVFELTRVEE